MQGFHQAVHSADADFNAIVALENNGDFVRPEALVVLGVYEENDLFNTLILYAARSRFRVKVLVIGTAVYSEHTAQRFDIMLVPELVNSL